MTDNLTKIRNRIADLTRERRDVQSAPQARATVEAAVLAQIDELATAGGKRINHLLSTRQVGEILAPIPQSAPAIQAALFADELAARLQPYVNALPVGITNAARARKLAEIEAGLEELGHAEMDEVQARERAGQSVTWRASQQPHIVLRLQAPVEPERSVPLVES